MLEQLAHDVTDWPAHAVEFFEQLATTQYMKHVRLQAPATADLRRHARRCSAARGPFNAIAHTAEMRRPESGAGRYNIPNVGIFLWRLLSLPLSGGAADAGSWRCERPQVPLQPARRRPAAVPLRRPRPTSPTSPSRSTCRSRSIGAADGAGGAGGAATAHPTRSSRRLRRRREHGVCRARQPPDPGAARPSPCRRPARHPRRRRQRRSAGTTKRR